MVEIEEVVSIQSLVKVGEHLDLSLKPQVDQEEDDKRLLQLHKIL